MFQFTRLLLTCSWIQQQSSNKMRWIKSIQSKSKFLHQPMPQPYLHAAGYCTRSNLNMEGLKRCGANYSPLTPISFLERAGKFYAEETSIIYGSVQFTWAETFERCLKLASGLSSLKVQRGDTVAAFAPNVPAMYELHFGVPMAGAVLCCLNIRLNAQTISVLLKHAEAKVVFVDYRFLDVIHKALMLVSEANAKVPVVIVIGELDSNQPARQYDTGLEYESFLSTGDRTFKIIWPEDERQAISLNYTSGTTSNPKGVVYSHRGAYLNTLATILMWGVKPSPVYLWTVPMFHCNGWCFAWAVAALGGTNVCIRNVTAQLVFDSIAQWGVTHFCGVPTALNIIINAKPQERKPMPKRVELLVGGAPPAPHIFSTMNELGFNVTHLYGLTETFGPATVCLWHPKWDSLPTDEQAKLKARQGVPHLGVSALDVKNPETMQSVRPDGKTIGEVMMKGNTIMNGYFKDEDATAKAFDGDWFHTGDLGVIHPDGYIELKDRAKDIIVSGGENISSIEVESVLYTHPDILEAAVVGRPDDYWGETPCAFVTLKNHHNSSLTSHDIIEFCRQKLPRFMTPRTIVFDELPKTATGKIQKYLLKQKAKALGSLSDGHVNKP